jgi:hypothetical protein
MTADDEDFPGKVGSPGSPNHYNQRVIRLLSADSMISDLTISASEVNAPLLTPRHSFRMSAMERRMNKGGPGPLGPGTGIGGGDKLTPTTEVKSIQRLSLRQQRQIDAINQRATGGNNVQDGGNQQRGRSADRGGGMMSRSMRSKSPASTGTGFSSEARGRSGFAFGRAMDNNNNNSNNSQTRGRSKTPVEDNLNSKYNSRYPNYLREGRSKSPSVTSSSRYNNRGVTRSHSPTMMSRGGRSSGISNNRSSKSPAPTRSRSTGGGGGRTTITRASSVPASATSSRRGGGSSAASSPSKTSFATARFFNSRTPAVSRSGRFNNTSSYTTRTTTTTTTTTRTFRSRSKSPAISERLERLSTPKGLLSPVPPNHRPANLKIPPRRSSSTPPAASRNNRSSSAGPRTTNIGGKEKSPKIREELHLPPSSTRRSVHDITISTINRVRSHSSPRPASKTLVSPQSSASSDYTPGGGASLVIDALGSKASLINHFSQNQKSPAAATMTAVLSPPSSTRRLAQETKEKSKFSPPPSQSQQQQKNSMNSKSFPSTVKSPQGTKTNQQGQQQQQTMMRSPPPSSPAVTSPSSSSSAARPNTSTLQRSSKAPPAAIANSRPIPFSNSSRAPVPSYMSPLQKNSPPVTAAATTTTTPTKGSVSNLYKNSTEKRVSSANWYADNYNSTAVEKNLLLSPTAQQQQQQGRGGRERSNSKSSVRNKGVTTPISSSGRPSSAQSSSRPNSRPSSMRQTTTIMYPDEPDEVRTSWSGRGSISSPNKANMTRPSYQITTEGTIPDDSALMEEMRNLSPQRANVINSHLTSSELNGDAFESDQPEEDEEEQEATANSHGSYIDDIDHNKDDRFKISEGVKDISIIERNESIDYQLSIDLNEDDSEEEEEEKGPEQLQNIRKGLVASLDHEKAAKAAITTFTQSTTTTATMTEMRSPMKDLNTLEKSNQKSEKADSEKKINEFISPALGGKSKSNDSLKRSNSFKETSVVNLFEEVEDDGMLSPTGNFLSRSHSSEKLKIINTHLTTAELKRLSSSGSLDENDVIPISLSLNAEASSNLNELAEIEAQQKRIAARLSSQGYEAGSSSAFSPSSPHLSSASPSVKQQQQLSEIEKISFSPMIRRTPTTEKMEILNTPLTTEELKSLSGDQNDLSSSLKKKLSRTASREEIVIVEQPSFERPKSWKSPPKPSTTGTAKEPEGIVPESQSSAMNKKSYEFSAATSPLSSLQKPPRPTSITDRKEKKFFEAEINNDSNILETNETTMRMISSPKRSVPSSPVSRRNSNASPSGNHISESNVTRMVTESSTTTHHQNNKVETTTHKEKNLKFNEHTSEYSMPDTHHDQQQPDNTPPPPVAVVLTDVPPIEDEETFLKIFLLSKMVTLTTTTTTKTTTTTTSSSSRPTSYKKESASTNNKIISPTAGNKQQQQQQQEKDPGEYVSSNTSINSAHSSISANTKETTSTAPTVKTIKRKREIFMPSLKHTSQKTIDTVYKVVKMKEESKNAMFNIQALLSKSSSMDFDDADYYQSPEEFLKNKNRHGGSFRSPPNSKGNHLSSHHFHYPASENNNNNNNPVPSPSRNSSNQAEGGASSKQTFYGYKRQLSVRNIEKLLSLTNYTFSPEGGRPSAGSPREKLEMRKPSFKAQTGAVNREEDGDDKSRVSHNSEFTYSTIKTTATHVESANTDNNNGNKPLELYTTDELIAEMNKIADFRLHQEENPQEEYNDDSDEEDVHALHADDLGEMVPLGKLSNQIPFTSADVHGKGTTTTVDHDDDSRRFTMSLV